MTIELILNMILMKCFQHKIKVRCLNCFFFVEWTMKEFSSGKKHELISEMIRKCNVNLYLDLFHTHILYNQKEKNTSYREQRSPQKNRISFFVKRI